MIAPLAERMRPQTLKDVIGQQHLVDKGNIIEQIIATKQPTSLILWGPPGSGKTTLARIIANETDAECLEISAVTAGKADIMAVMKHAEQNTRLGQKTILFVDEIHRFSKSQQDAFLPYVEQGIIALIGATTENPSFEIITPLLSRMRVVVLNPHSESDIVAIVRRAATTEGITKTRLPKASVQLLAHIASGDARVALGHLELAITLAGKSIITPEIITTAAQTRVPGYDKNGDQHYNIISAFIKSMRGSDVRATLYYMARMLQAGEDPSFIARRMVIFASEDIGLAGNGALSLAVATFDAVKQIGMPEAQYNLYHCAVALARSAKSRETTDLMHAAQHLADTYPNEPVPLHIRNAPTKLMKDLAYGKDYKWEAGHKPKKGFLPLAITENEAVYYD